MKKEYIYASILIIVVISAAAFIAFSGGKFTGIEKATEGKEQPVGPVTGDNVTEEEQSVKYSDFECEEPCNFDYDLADIQCTVQQDSTKISFKVRNRGKALVEHNDDGLKLTVKRDGETTAQKEFVWPEATLPEKTSSRHSFTFDKGLGKGTYNLTSDWNAVANTYVITCRGS